MHWQIGQPHFAGSGVVASIRTSKGESPFWPLQPSTSMPASNQHDILIHTHSHHHDPIATATARLWNGNGPTLSRQRPQVFPQPTAPLASPTTEPNSNLLQALNNKKQLAPATTWQPRRDVGAKRRDHLFPGDRCIPADFGVRGAPKLPRYPTAALPSLDPPRSASTRLDSSCSSGELMSSLCRRETCNRTAPTGGVSVCLCAKWSCLGSICGRASHDCLGHFEYLHADVSWPPSHNQDPSAQLP
ncbi:hypothetical protein BD289DRAFT_240088 [Coniella lustricola]|uniref:Uncharacterized protein n=1 Tax=Coniella lustricola TaxID=2025994 RepID=A0A2T3ALE5_9PEZI|nr:hypothetical protein BD289DRAFT_240088 [Coniella lustricola]